MVMIHQSCNVMDYYKDGSLNFSDLSNNQEDILIKYLKHNNKKILMSYIKKKMDLFNYLFIR